MICTAGGIEKRQTKSQAFDDQTPKILQSKIGGTVKKRLSDKRLAVVTGRLSQGPYATTFQSVAALFFLYPGASRSILVERPARMAQKVVVLPTQARSKKLRYWSIAAKLRSLFELG